MVMVTVKSGLKKLRTEDSTLMKNSLKILITLKKQEKYLSICKFARRNNWKPNTKTLKTTTKIQ